jgi:hypothetical protein
VISIGWIFIFGSCSSTGESGCLPPLQVRNYSICRRWPRKSDRLHLFDFRGARATGSGGPGNSLEIFTGRTTVVISATHHRTAAIAARKLRDVRQTHNPSRLPPPAPGSLSGRLHCQHHAEVGAV